MEIKRLYDSEKRLLIIKTLIIFITAAGISIFLFAKGSTTFKDYLVKTDTKKLYEYIEKPDFSYEIFCAYMKYNYGTNIEVLDTIKDKNSIKYKVKGNNSEKSIYLVNKNGRYCWIFDDYVYNWRIKLHKDAVITIEKTPIENNDGIAVIEKIPFGLYEICVESDFSEVYKAKMLAGQSIEIKLKPSYEAVKKSEESVIRFLEFKESTLKNKKIEEVDNCIKESGVYKEIIDEVEWQKANGYSMVKDLKSYNIKKAVMDTSGLIYINVEEDWEITVNNDGRNEKRLETFNNTYIINPNLKYLIEGIKTN